MPRTTYHFHEAFGEVSRVASTTFSSVWGWPRSSMGVERVMRHIRRTSVAAPTRRRGASGT
eukprot:9329798-Pyramimonas_sp.AAC.1